MKKEKAGSKGLEKMYFGNKTTAWVQPHNSKEE